MKTLEDRILHILADVIARLIVGLAAAAFVLFHAMAHMPVQFFRQWSVMLALASAAGVIVALFGLRKGPGAI